MIVNNQKESKDCVFGYFQVVPPKSLQTDRDAVWHVDSGESKKACARWGAHSRNLTNTSEVSMCSGGDAAFLSNYFDHLLLLWP